MLTLYDYLDSGNGYKVRLLLAQLGRPCERIELDIDRGETRTPDFLAINPNGRIPALVLDDGRPLAESNAILCYLAEGTPFLPADPYERALVMQWLFFEQYSHEPYIAVARYLLRHLPADHPRRARLPELRERGHQALAVMEGHLAGNAFFVGGRYSIADIALYAYTHVAADGGYDLSGYPALGAWLQRIAAQPGHRGLFDLAEG
ncbi:glutathione S-transferase [Tistlia consotensis]|uniref:Glutathione S-transferase n=1 Tax=Tistlia consotensis USBA 355 TaxID=560819 RepID=A0A1Y6B9F0_9PROT|nr:glutathione S-transferase family protein [Tistlia consotensis]SME88608.1 glutathione S-transferase [Tistlia consotensis USBA 355]SNR25133.1 glutathione S-transferase [Tistlia consotensis]